MTPAEDVGPRPVAVDHEDFDRPGVVAIEVAPGVDHRHLTPGEQ